MDGSGNLCATTEVILIDWYNYFGRQFAQNAILGYSLKNDRMISVHLQGKPFSITVFQVYAPISNTEEAEVERLYEDLQDLLELTTKKDAFSL